ncbi:MAG: hypothetical protein LQ339_007739 [Xanthoria mediterranea]|nr:MAG: hypothetical protein LQ339_007739 [Xanthoria mediterranea]
MARAGIRWSQGCKICRQRKIKCGKCHSKRRCCHSHLTWADEKHPSCSACTRLGVTCPGPQIRTTFIKEHPDQPGKASSRQVILPPGGTSVVSQNVSTSSSQCMVVQAWLSRQCLHAAQDWNISLPKEDHYTTLFLSKFKTEAVGVWAPFTWLSNDLVAYNGNASISRRFAQNLAQAFFGHYFALPQVLNAAQAEYGRNLLILKQSLDAPKIVASDDLFRGILTAVVFELIVQTSSSAWIIHLLALARIIQSREPNVYRTLSEKSDLAMCRAILTGYAIIHRRRPFFDSPQWRPLESQHPQGDLLHQLTDIHIQVPGLLEDFDQICCSESTPSATFTALNHLRDRTIELINSLFAWRWEWERQHADQVWEVLRPPSSQVPHDKATGSALYPTLFEFPDIVRLGEISRYNGILCILLNLLDDVCGNDDASMQLLDRFTPTDMLHRAHRSPLCLPSDAELSSRNAAAEHIRCVEKPISQDSHISSTGLMLVLGLNLIYKTLPPEDPLRLWIQRIYCNISSAAGAKEMIKDDKRRDKVPHPMHWKRFYLPPSED